MGNGTPYGFLKRMLADALVEEAGEDTRRRYWRLTGRGRAALHAEIRRLEQTLAAVRGYALVP